MLATLLSNLLVNAIYVYVYVCMGRREKSDFYLPIYQQQQHHQDACTYLVFDIGNAWDGPT